MTLFPKWWPALLTPPLILLGVSAPLVTLHSQGVGYLDTIDLLGEKYDVHRVTSVEGWGFSFNALNNRQEFTTEFGTYLISSAAGNVANNAGGFSNGGRFLMISSQDWVPFERSNAEDVNDSGVFIGWRELLNEPPRSFIYSNLGIQYLDELFPAVKVLADTKQNPGDADPVGTKGLRIYNNGDMLIEGVTTGEGAASTRFYLVSASGSVSAFVISENNPFPEPHGRSPNKDGWFGEYPGFIHDSGGNITDIRLVIQDQLAESPFISEWPVNGGSETLINDARDITWGNLVFLPACPDPRITFTAEGLEFIDGTLTAFVGDIITINYTITNWGRGPMKNITIAPDPGTSVLNILSGPSPPYPARLEPGEVFVTTVLWEVANAGDYAGAFVVYGEGACGPVEARVNTLFSQYFEPDLGIKIEPKPEEVEISEEIKVDIFLTNNSDEEMTDVQLAGSVTLTGDGAVEIMEGFTPLLFEKLAPGDTKALSAVYEATGPGTVAFNAAATAMKGNEATASPMTRSGDVSIAPPLVVTLRAKALEGEKEIPIVNMEVSEDPENPGIFIVKNEAGIVIVPKVEVTIKNTSKQAIKVFLQSITPLARDRSAVVTRIEVDDEPKKEGDPNRSFPYELPDEIPGGESVSIDYPLIIRQDGRFEFSAFVTGTLVNSKGAPFFQTAKGAPIAVGEPYPMEIEFELVRRPTITDQNNGAFKVDPGGQVKFLAVVRNLTSNSTIEFNGIDAVGSGNAFGGVLASESGQAVPPCPAFTVDEIMDANSFVLLSGAIVTEVGGAPSGTIVWTPPENIKLIDDLTKEEKVLTEDDILVKYPFPWWQAKKWNVHVVQDNSLPDPPPPLTDNQRDAYYWRGALLSIGHWTYGTFDAIGGIGRGAGTIWQNPTLVADALGETSRAVWEAAELAAKTWEKMSDDQRSELLEVMALETFRRIQLLATLRLPFDKNDFTQVTQWTQDITYPLFNGMEQAYASNDPARIAELWGTIAGNVALEAAMCFLPAPQFTKYTEAADLTRLATNADNARLLDDPQKFIQIADGPLTKADAAFNWGIEGAELTRTQEVFKWFGIKGYARERSPRSFNLINELFEAVWKPEHMKPKGMSRIDFLMLGDPSPTGTNLHILRGKPPQNNPIELDGITAIINPPDDATILRRLKEIEGEVDIELTQAVKDSIIARAGARREKFHKYRAEFEGWAKPLEEGGGIPVAFNYVDNGVRKSQGAPKPPRKFEFETIDLEDGSQMLIPKMANEAGDLRYISGDIDWVHFSFLNGQPLDEVTAALFYKVMQKCCGLQHGETIAWMNKGQTIFKAKANQLTEYIKATQGAEVQKALLEVSGGQLRAVRIVEQLTRFAADGRNHLVFFDSGIKSRLFSKIADIETAFAMRQAYIPRPGLLQPIFWPGIAATGPNDTSLNGNPWETSAEANALIIRQNFDDALEWFNGQNWLRWSVPESTSPKLNGDNQPPGWTTQQADPGTILLAPITTIEAAVLAGTTQLPIEETAQYWQDELSEHLVRWFEVGDTVVIDPGTASQEVRHVVAMDPMTLDEPLEFNHLQGSIVALVPPGRMVTKIPVEVMQVTHSAVSENNLQITVDLVAPPETFYSLETSTDMETWIPTDVSSVEGGYSRDNLILLTDQDNTISINIDLDTKNTPQQFFRLTWE